jgi:hypothetical protein
MDTDGVSKRRKRRRKYSSPVGSRGESLNGTKEPEDKLVDDGDSLKDGVGETRLRRECPVPKPSGILGEILGFKSGSRRDSKGPNQPP